ncbi:hypothetical protein AQUCO_01200034v1 [Aquilegia coerulea]|uniref:Uncharacterized protein n=1 Tax=Aquilegia coerulea TaxID=218851 RepID=A0A2G5E488_AQUCA|nr:hypothetical protein AQUCO_01200034v1 [Aquilegia coerulea]
MNLKQVSLVVICCFFIYKSADSRRVAVGQGSNGETLYTDHFIFALQWMRIAPQRFTIKGLWPRDSLNLEKQPEYCKNDTDIDLTWFGVKKDDNVEMWREEWLRHGTCSGLTNYQYFHLALELIHEVDVLNALRSNGYYPGSHYKPMDLINTVLNKMGVYPRIVCEHGNPMIKEIHFNFTNGYPSSSVSMLNMIPPYVMNCGQFENIYLPALVDKTKILVSISLFVLFCISLFVIVIR